MPVDRDAASDGLQGARMVAEDGGRVALSGGAEEAQCMRAIIRASPPFHKLAKTILKSIVFEIRPLTKRRHIFLLLLPIDLPRAL